MRATATSTSIELRPSCWPGTNTRRLRPIAATTAPAAHWTGGNREHITSSRLRNIGKSAAPGSRRRATPTRPRHRFAAATPHWPGVPRMAEASGNTPAAGQIDAGADASLLSQLDMMIGALWASPARGAIAAITGAAIAVVVVTAYGQVRLNRWNQPFYDALSRRNMRGFAIQLAVFAVIAGALLLLNVGQRWLGEMLKLK